MKTSKRGCQRSVRKGIAHLFHQDSARVVLGRLEHLALLVALQRLLRAQRTIAVIRNFLYYLPVFVVSKRSTQPHVAAAVVIQIFNLSSIFVVPILNATSQLSLPVEGHL